MSYVLTGITFKQLDLLKLSGRFLASPVHRIVLMMMVKLIMVKMVKMMMMIMNIIKIQNSKTDVVRNCEINSVMIWKTISLNIMKY